MAEQTSGNGGRDAFDASRFRRLETLLFVAGVGGVAALALAAVIDSCQQRRQAQQIDTLSDKILEQLDAGGDGWRGSVTQQLEQQQRALERIEGQQDGAARPPDEKE